MSALPCLASDPASHVENQRFFVVARQFVMATAMLVKALLQAKAGAAPNRELGA
ncbi:hypothetical protein [Mesorhizobium sp.]|uniref:hypothetical protein n=1 Tax=Mesorhizobium sp. TaxID=1871066 RepID=UPI0025C36F74|nr:hypothetical protein [Mesorhizobium sp.]